MRLLSETKESENSQQKYENLKVEKGLTHIKYNKFAPTADEAVNMTDEQFRAVIMTRMLEAEKERRASGPVGNTASDNYLDNLSAPKAAVREVNTNGKKRYGLSKQNNRIISNDKTETH
jgi:F0F1-type ATP synthase epsilon subunit